MPRLLFFISFFVLALFATAQKTDSTSVVKDSIYVPDTSQFKTDFRKKFSLRWHMQPHSPLKATLFSAVVPGAGQIYNGMAKEGSVFRKYWKAPIVYGGIATCIAFIDFNTNKYHFYRTEYILRLDGDESTVPNLPYATEDIKLTMEQYHRWMDVSYMALFGVYLLQVIDANVDAHLFYFDISKDLSLNVHPSFVNTGHINPGIGLTFGF